MGNKENNKTELVIKDIDSRNEIDISAQKEGFKSISLVKKLSLFLVGCFGIYLISLILLLIFKAASGGTYDEGILEFVVYTILFVILATIVNVDVKKLKVDFKKWQNILIGLGFGIVMIVIPIIYTTVVSLFYEYSINDNESSLRAIIKVYPVASVFIFAIVGPVCEELTYRVGLFGSLSKIKWLAYVITILVFAFAHFSFTSKHIIDELVNLPIYLISGAIMAIAYDKFGFLASTTAHIANNLYAVIGTIIAVNM